MHANVAVHENVLVIILQIAGKEAENPQSSSAAARRTAAAARRLCRVRRESPGRRPSARMPSAGVYCGRRLLSP